MNNDVPFDHDSYIASWPFPVLNQDDMPIPCFITTGFAASLLMREFFQAVSILEETGNPQPLNALAGRTVGDSDGNTHVLPDANFIALWLASQSDDFRRAWKQHAHF